MPTSGNARNAPSGEVHLTLNLLEDKYCQKTWKVVFTH